MPDVKWAESGFLLAAKYRDVYRGMVPVITLDDLEVWLKNERSSVSQCVNSQQAAGRNGVLRDMLEQVQAWKDGV